MPSPTCYKENLNCPSLYVMYGPRARRTSVSGKTLHVWCAPTYTTSRGSYDPQRVTGEYGRCNRTSVGLIHHRAVQGRTFMKVRTQCSAHHGPRRGPGPFGRLHHQCPCNGSDLCSDRQGAKTAVTVKCSVGPQNGTFNVRVGPQYHQDGQGSDGPSWFGTP